MTTPCAKPALRYHGAKFRLAPWVMQFFPPHRCYVEPFGGAGGVLLRKEPSYAEVYNDLDGDVVNFFRVLRNPAQRAELIESLTLTPYARDEFDLAWEPADAPVESARRLAIRAQMGFGSAGATKGRTGFRVDTRRRYGTAPKLWASYPDGVAVAGRRFAEVMIENRPALEVIEQHDSADTLFFVDPPYVHSARAMRSNPAGYYRHEMSDVDHHQLIDALLAARGMVVLSGYTSPLYRERLSGWATYSTSSRIAAGRGTRVRQEHVWLNPACSAGLNRQAGSLFAEDAGSAPLSTPKENSRV